jgi:hypothetical protein
VHTIHLPSADVPLIRTKIVRPAFTRSIVLMTPRGRTVAHDSCNLDSVKAVQQPSMPSERTMHSLSVKRQARDLMLPDGKRPRIELGQQRAVDVHSRNDGALICTKKAEMDMSRMSKD